MERKKISSFPVIILLTTLLIVSVFFYKFAFGWYPAKYTESAHGNYADRSAISSIGYAVGNCAHCHYQHASIEGTSHTAYDFGLFAPNNQDSQDDNFCFQCHKGAGSVQVGGITNKNYSHAFGGAADPPDFTNIKDAFNPGTEPPASSHNLKDIQDLHTDLYDFTSDNNACVACHNPHTAQRNYEVTDSGREGVKTAIRDAAIGYRDRPTNLWGDEPRAASGYYELTSDANGTYQAPYRVGKTTYEPAGDQTADGTNLPGFANFCWQCHRFATVYSTERLANLRAVDWTIAGNIHGVKANGLSDTAGHTIAPYTADDTTNYVLSCTDCHEPHGSTNEWLLRTCVNGKDNISITQAGRWYELCTACHQTTSWSNHDNTVADCSTCHGHSEANF